MTEESIISENKRLCACGRCGQYIIVGKTIDGKERQYIRGHNNIGQNNSHWKGGRHKRLGYWLIYKPKHPFANNVGNVQEHRLVMEKQLGRYLTKEEVVHHINGDKTDNRIENLQLMTNGEHVSLEQKGRPEPPRSDEWRRKQSESHKGQIPWNKKN